MSENTAAAYRSAVVMLTEDAKLCQQNKDELADRLAALLKLGIPKNMTYTRSEIAAVISELRGEA